MVEEDNGPPIYENLEPFTVNLADRDTYLRVEIKLRMATPEIQEKLKELMPDVRNDILNLLSSKQPDELSTPEGKTKLASEIQGRYQRIVESQARPGCKEGVVWRLFDPIGETWLTISSLRKKSMRYFAG